MEWLRIDLEYLRSRYLEEAFEAIETLTGVIEAGDSWNIRAQGLLRVLGEKVAAIANDSRVYIDMIEYLSPPRVREPSPRVQGEGFVEVKWV